MIWLVFAESLYFADGEYDARVAAITDVYLLPGSEFIQTALHPVKEPFSFAESFFLNNKAGLHFIVTLVYHFKRYLYLPFLHAGKVFFDGVIAYVCYFNQCKDEH